MQNVMIIEGERYGMFTVIQRAGRKNGHTVVLARCDCGNEKEIRLDSIKSGLTESCGCLRVGTPTHQLSKHPLYKVYYSIRHRCYSINNKQYKDYGGRGIKVCEQWLNDFMCFYTWAINNGWKKGLQIDRINNSGNYEPSNCRFVPKIINARNTRANVYIEYNGQTKAMSEWALLFKIPAYLLGQRLRRDKLSFTDAITKPLRQPL